MKIANHVYWEKQASEFAGDASLPNRMTQSEIPSPPPDSEGPHRQEDTIRNVWQS
jgi:hypothetical protein